MRSISSVFFRFPAIFNLSSALYSPTTFRIRYFSCDSISRCLNEGDPTVCSSNETPSFSLPALQPSLEADHLSSLLLHHYNPFHAAESSLQLHGVELSPALVFQTLVRLRNLSKVAFSFFLSAKSHPQFCHDSASYDLMIDILGKVRQFDVAWQLIIEMDQKNVRPTSRTFALLIRRLISAGLTRQAIRALDDMESFVEKAANYSDLSHLLDTLCKHGYVKIAVEIFNKRKYVFQLDVRIYTVLIDGWCKINRTEMAEKFLREMIDLGIEPNVVTYNVLLNGICRKASLHPDERLKRTIQATSKVFDEMYARGIEPDATSYSVVLHVYSRAHKPGMTLNMLKEMREKRLCPTIVTYTSVVKCLCSCGRIGDAEALLGKMESEGVNPSAVTYNCFFKEYRGRKDLDSALKLYRMMKKQAPTLPSMHSYNILVSMFGRLNRLDLVEELWNDMKESGVGPDLDSYTLLIHGLCERQKWRSACEFFVEMIEQGFLPQKVTFETLYRGLIQSDMLRTWRRLKKKLEEESITFGSEFEAYHLKPYRR